MEILPIILYGTITFNLFCTAGVMYIVRRSWLKRKTALRKRKAVVPEGEMMHSV